MKEFGFYTFDELIDSEKYESIENIKERLVFVCDSIKEICEWDLNKLENYFVNQKNNIEHNYNRLKELIDENDKKFLELFNY